MGGTGGERANFGRIAAKVPARRCATALDRLLRLYARERQPSESPEVYFQRVDLSRVTALLADLATLTPETATAADFVDLGESAPFSPQTLDGECSA